MAVTTRKKNPPDATRKEVSLLRARVKKLEQQVRQFLRLQMMLAKTTDRLLTIVENLQRARGK